MLVQDIAKMSGVFFMRHSVLLSAMFSCNNSMLLDHRAKQLLHYKKAWTQCTMCSVSRPTSLPVLIVLHLIAPLHFTMTAFFSLSLRTHCSVDCKVSVPLCRRDVIPLAERCKVEFVLNECMFNCYNSRRHDMY